MHPELVLGLLKTEGALTGFQKRDFKQNYRKADMILSGKKAAYITLGCKLNFSETSTIRQSLENAGVETVDEKKGADIFIINTCSVTDVAERKGRQMIRKIIHRHPGAYIVIVGCYAQLRAKELMQIEGVSMVLGANEKFKVEEYLRFTDEQQKHEPHSCDIFKLSNFDLACSFGDRTRCFLKIQDGCDYFCSYCTIPFARGKSRSASVNQVVETARSVAQKGIKEIILTGVNTGDFGRGSQETFSDLLQALDKIEEISRFRISSIEPNLLTDEIIHFVASSSRFMPHFHIPLQSGSNEVLRLMKRRYTRELFADKVQTIKSLLPDAFIGVDVIAGMRGETESYFNDAFSFISQLDISRLHVFPYSERQGTKALEIKEAVSPAEKHRRVEALLELSEQKLNRFYKLFTGTTRNVLFEDNHSNGLIGGFTDNYIRIERPYDAALANQIIPVTLIPELFGKD